MKTVKRLVLVSIFVIIFTGCGINNASRGGSRNYKLVFVVDDCATSQLCAYARIQSLNGVAVRAYDSGSDAIDNMDSGKPDLIVTDLHMPGIDGLGIDGLEVCKAAYTLRIKCLVMSSGIAIPKNLFESGVDYGSRVQTSLFG